MSHVCDVCGKRPSFGQSVGRRSRWTTGRTSRRWDANIQAVRVRPETDGGNTKHLQVCTSCIKAGKVVRARPRSVRQLTEKAA